MRLFTLAASAQLISGFSTDNYEGQGSQDKPMSFCTSQLDMNGPKNPERLWSR